MNFPRLVRLERALVYVLAASFALPSLLGLVLLFPPFKNRATAVWRDRTLSDAHAKPALLPATAANLLSARYQTSLAQDYDATFAGREVLIRTLDEIYLRLFHTVPSGTLVGPHGWLYELNYATEYAYERGDDAALRSLVDQLRRMQDFCRDRGIAFALLLTPSKADVYPEQLPAAWQRRYRPLPRSYDRLVPLLRAAGVCFVDGHALAVDMKPRSPVPVFPAGGIHWGQPLALAATNAVLARLAAQGLPVHEITRYEARSSTHPVEEDADLADHLNRLAPPRYPVVTLQVPPVVVPPPAVRPNLVVVGGSFTGMLLRLLNDSGQFSELDQYFYYQTSKNVWLDGQRHPISEPTAPVDFDREIFAADALVLEANEQTLPQPAAHLTAFLRDALAALPADPRSSPPPFHSEGHADYAWGDSLSFQRGRATVNLAATVGFIELAARGSTSFGPESSLHLHVDPAPTDMVLEVTGSPYHLERSAPTQTVAVFVNGHAAGSLRWTSRAETTQRLPVPRAWLQGNELRLSFRPAHLFSPEELGDSRDNRPLGFRVSQLRFVAAPN